MKHQINKHVTIADINQLDSNSKGKRRIIPTKKIAKSQKSGLSPDNTGQRRTQALKLNYEVLKQKLKNKGNFI